MPNDLALRQRSVAIDLTDVTLALPAHGHPFHDVAARTEAIKEHHQERLQHLVQDYMKRASRLLDISRIEAGNLQLQSSHADLSGLVHSVAERYEAEAVSVSSPNRPRARTSNR